MELIKFVNGPLFPIPIEAWIMFSLLSSRVSFKGGGGGVNDPPKWNPGYYIHEIIPLQLTKMSRTILSTIIVFLLTKNVNCEFFCNK